MQKGNPFLYWIKVVSLGIALGLGLQFAQAWTAPTLAPPLGNVGGPVTLGDGAQYKTGKLGVNSATVPLNALEVGGGGNVLVGGKVYSSSTVATDLGGTLATKDYVDAKIAAALSGGGGSGGVLDLVYGRHSSAQCTDAGGVVLTDGSDKYCRFNSSTPPGGWSLFKSWTATTPNTCSGDVWLSCGENVGPAHGTSCTTGSHAVFSNVAVETCPYELPSCYGFIHSTCAASITKIGAY